MDKKEPMFEAKVIGDGRITIPDGVRKIWEIKEGDKLVLLICEKKKAEAPK